MATAKVPKSQRKVTSRNLTNSSALLCRVYQSDTIYNVVLSCRLPGYEQLEEDVMYYECYENNLVCCTLRTLMRSSSLYVCVVGNTIPLRTNAEFTVMGEPSLRSMVMKADEVDSRIFMAEFPRKSFFGPCLDNLLRNDCILTVSFKYESDVKVAYKTCSVEAIEMLGDLSGFCCDLKKMYYEALNADFLILLGEIGFKAHRFILSGRSDFFKTMFVQNRNAAFYELEDFPHPGIVHEVLVYLYSGDLRKMDVPSMLWVYDLAFRFKVVSLSNRCGDYFRANLDKDNCKAVAIFARLKGYADLKNIVAYFLPTVFPGINIAEYFKDVEREFLEFGSNVL